jgi:hypothetical protein
MAALLGGGEAEGVPPLGVGVVQVRVLRLRLGEKG